MTESIITWQIPAIGRETAQMVLDQITSKPQSHNQGFWEEGEGCGTNRCVGGWAQFFHEGKVDFSEGQNHVDFKAREYLAINESDSLQLFWNTNNEQAVAALEYLARGEQIDWAEVFGNDDDDDDYEPEGIG